jgi:hypothetical protein
VRSTVGDEAMWPYFNSGLVMVPRALACALQVSQWSRLSTAGGAPLLGYPAGRVVLELPLDSWWYPTAGVPGWACGVSGAASRQLVVSHHWGTRLGVWTRPPAQADSLARGKPGIDVASPLLSQVSIPTVKTIM